MSRIIRVFGFGLFLGSIMVFFLIMALGLKMTRTPGKTTQEFLGLNVLQATKTLSKSGSSVSMKPLPGILVPLLSPALIFMAGNLLVRSRRSKANNQ